MSKQYGYKDLIEAYVATKRRYIHPDFTNYYVGLFHELANLFNIHFVSEELGAEPKFVPEKVRETSTQRSLIRSVAMLALFNATIGIYLAIHTPWDEFLEGGLGITVMSNAYGDKFRHLSAEYKETHLDLLDTLFKMMYGEIETVVTSEQLLERGFDDSNEPELYDYNEYM